MKGRRDSSRAASTTKARQQEKPRQREGRTPHLEGNPCSLQLEKAGAHPTARGVKPTKILTTKNTASWRLHTGSDLIRAGQGIRPPPLPQVGSPSARPNCRKANAVPKHGRLSSALWDQHIHHPALVMGGGYQSTHLWSPFYFQCRLCTGSSAYSKVLLET